MSSARADGQSLTAEQRALLARFAAPLDVASLDADPEMESPCFEWLDADDRAWSACFDQPDSARFSLEVAHELPERVAAEALDLASREIDLIMRLALRDADVAAWIAAQPGRLDAALQTRVRVDDPAGAARAKADLERGATLLRALVELRIRA